MNEFQISEISSRYMRAVGKYYIMHSNLGTGLLGFDGETVHLRVSAGKGWIKDPATTAIELANSWVRFNPELNAATKFVVELETQNAFKAPPFQQGPESPLFAFDLANRTVIDLTNPPEPGSEPFVAKLTISGSLDAQLPPYQLAPPVGSN
jgi:hypothetical protein